MRKKSKKSKTKKSKKPSSPRGVNEDISSSLVVDNGIVDDGYIRPPYVDIIMKEARDLCPEAKEFYSITKEMFENELWDEIQTYWLEPGSTVSKDVVWTLVQPVRLESLKTQAITDVEHEGIGAAEELELLYTIPYQYTKKKYQYRNGPQRHHQYWSVRWMDVIPGYRQTILGSMACGPFFEDPPQDSCEIDQYKMREGWNLRNHVDNPIALECIRLGVGLTKNDLSVKDVARCLIPTIGLLGKYHPGNHNRILQRTMLRFERQVRTWNNGDQSNPNEWEMSETLRRRGGMLSHPAVVAKLERENRWLVN